MRKILLALAVALALAGCDAFSGGGAPLPTVVLGGPAAATTPGAATAQPRAGTVVASGVVAPAQQANLTFALGARVKAVGVAAGDSVQAGQVLVTLVGAEKISAAAAAASLELLSAQQALAALNDNAAQARAQAQQALANAQKALKDAQDERYRKNLARVAQTTLDQVQSDLIIAQDVLKRAKEDYAKVENYPENDLTRAQFFSRLAAAQQKVDSIQYNLDWLLSRPDSIEVQQADAAIAVAQARVTAAQRDYERLKSGPDPDALALAKARVENAQAQLAAAQAGLADLELKAPFAGTVSKLNIHPGEWVSPGLVVLSLVDVTRLKVETTDLSERDVPRVQVGQAAVITVKALGQELKGKVSAIAPLADSLGGDVVYKATVELDTVPAGLRAGMSVDVRFGGN